MIVVLVCTHAAVALACLVIGVLLERAASRKVRGGTVDFTSATAGGKLHIDYRTNATVPKTTIMYPPPSGGAAQPQSLKWWWKG